MRRVITGTRAYEPGTMLMDDKPVTKHDLKRMDAAEAKRERRRLRNLTHSSK
jgi:hypothetical protein